MKLLCDSFWVTRFISLAASTIQKLFQLIWPHTTGLSQCGAGLFCGGDSFTCFKTMLQNNKLVNLHVKKKVNRMVDDRGTNEIKHVIHIQASRISLIPRHHHHPPCITPHPITSLHWITYFQQPIISHEP